MAEFPFHSNDQEWLLSWHEDPLAPAGTRHGSAGICLTAEREVVLVSRDAAHWDFPAGRPEGRESWEETLRREVREEACVAVSDARLLGYSCGRCVRGPQEGEVLVRALWLARVRVEPWEPRFEMRSRRLVPASDLLTQLRAEGERLPMTIYERALVRAGIL